MPTNAEQHTLSRDDVAKLVGVPFNTIAVWRHKGFVNPPTIQGATARQSRFNADDAFALFAFKLACDTQGVRQSEAATLSRYLRHRPGTVETLYHYWERPVSVAVYPTHDLAAFNVPMQLLLDKVVSASEVIRPYAQELRQHLRKTTEARGQDLEDRVRYAIYDKYPVEHLLANVLHQDATHAIGNWVMPPEGILELEARSDPELKGTNVRAQWATTVFRIAKNLQYKNIPRFHVHLGGPDYADYSNMSTEDHLVVEAWALKWIDDALLFYGLSGPPNSEGGTSPHFEVDVTPALDKVIEAFGRPSTPARELRPTPSSADELRGNPRDTPSNA